MVTTLQIPVADGGRYPLSATLCKQQILGGQDIKFSPICEKMVPCARTPVPRQETPVPKAGNESFPYGKLTDTQWLLSPRG